MPLGLGAPPPMGGMNPQNLQALAAAGDPRAIAMLQQMQAGQGQMAPPNAGGPLPPMGAVPSMSQAEFSGYGQGPAPQDVEARRAQMLIQALRNRQ